MVTTDVLDMALSDVIKANNPKKGGKGKGKTTNKRAPVKGRGTVVAGNAKQKARENTQKSRSAMRSDSVAQRRGIFSSPSPSSSSSKQRLSRATTSATVAARSLARRAIQRQQTLLPRRLRNQSNSRISLVSTTTTTSSRSPLKISLGSGNSRSIIGNRNGGGLARPRSTTTTTSSSRRVSSITSRLRNNRQALLRPSSLMSSQSVLMNRRLERKQQTGNARAGTILQG
eukprot:TRINITY_DN3168_c0_g1_i3.p1 TRINITY_DN3168_c0_g1~~TRINITY_DN3168_c0_g1_i3.p1  ORF type:complete len:229 (-),score=69.70 TRINITY_DN3168_c0_g1_i3:102-788(-)